MHKQLDNIKIKGNYLIKLLKNGLNFMQIKIYKKIRLRGWWRWDLHNNNQEYLYILIY